MKAIILNTDRNRWDKESGYQLAELPEPPRQIGEHEVIIEPIFTGFCGTDKGIWNRKAFKDAILHSLETDKRKYYVMGHELLGKVSRVGSDVKNFEVGQIVSAESHVFCGICPNCKSGKQHVCMNERILGVTRDGVYAEKIVVPDSILWPTDINKIRPEVAAIQEPFGNAVHVCTPLDQGNENQLQGKSVLVLGCGTIGLFTILIARCLGAAKIIGIEPNPTNQKRALACGANKVLHPDSEIIEAVKAEFDGYGPEFCFEMTGIPSSINTAISAGRRGGHVVLFGLSKGDLVIPSFEKMIIAGMSIHSIVGRRVFNSWKTTKKLLEDNTNGIQDSIWEHILSRGQGSIIPIGEFNQELVESKGNEHAKILFQFSHI